MNYLDLLLQIVYISTLALNDLFVDPSNLFFSLIVAFHPTFDNWVEKAERLPIEELTLLIVIKKLYHEEIRQS